MSEVESTVGQLQSRRGGNDEVLADELLAALAPFHGRIDHKKLSRHTGAVILRRYRPGEAICRQAEPGWTAFFIVPATDMLRLRQLQIAATESTLECEPQLAGRSAAEWTARLEEARAQADDAENRAASLDRALKLMAKDVQKLKTKSQQSRHQEKLAVALAAASDLDPRFEADTPEGRKHRVAAAESEAKALRASFMRLNTASHESKLPFLHEHRRELEGRLASTGAEPRPVANVTLQFNKAHHRTSAARKAYTPPGPLERLVARVKRSFAPAKVERRRFNTGYISIPVDLPVDLPSDNPTTTLLEGDLFGEMSCMNATPRSATVSATETVYVLEFLRSVLEVLQKNKAFNAWLLETYKARALQTHVRDLPLFANLSSAARELLHERVTLSCFDAGAVIFKTGDEPDAMYAVRIGHVKVFREVDGVIEVLAYVGRSELIGEMGLIENKPREATCEAYDHPPGSGKASAGRVEMIGIDRALFEEVRALDPKFDHRVRQVIEKRRREMRDRPGDAVAIGGPVDSLGLIQGKRLMLIDLERCTRCDDCVSACAATHDDGRSRLVREGPRLGNFLVPTSCRQCRDPVCTIGCPVGSIHKGDFGQIVIEDWCIGCSVCADQCPYGSISMAPRDEGERIEEPVEGLDEKPLAVVCDQCTSLKDGIPSCVYACPHDAAGRVDAFAFFSDGANRDRSLRELTYENLRAAPRSSEKS